MFRVKPGHIRRVSFATKLFPKPRSSIKLDTSKLASAASFDGELFCGGRSKNKDLLTFFGFVSDPNSCASYVQLPAFRRALKKLTNLVEQELETIGAHEVLMPTLVPQKLWQKSKRFERQLNALDNVYNFTDDAGVKVLLGPTFEESMTQMVAGVESLSESELPLLVYQTSSKFRFEPNPRFGLIRSNEFLMNDLYSFDADLIKAAQSYDTITNVYHKIFNRLGLDCVRVQSDTGNIGGKYSHEFQLPVSSGEDTIVKCNSCGSAYNVEMCQDKLAAESSCRDCGGNKVELSQALELGHTFLLSDTYSKPMKARYTSHDGNSRINLEMGSYGLGMTRILGAGVDLLSIIPTLDCASNSVIQIRWPTGVEPYKIGIIAPAKRSKQYHGGSSGFIEQFVNKVLESTQDVDILVEDRDKDGIGKRIIKLQSIGIPYIVVVGQKFLQDQPEIELLKLDSDKKGYEQIWFTEDQLLDYISRLDQ